MGTLGGSGTLQAITVQQLDLFAGYAHSEAAAPDYACAPSGLRNAGKRRLVAICLLRWPSHWITYFI
jgi:hypothetical protein